MSQGQAHSHLIDLHGPLLDGDLLLPSGELLGLQRLNGMVEDDLPVMVVLGHVHLWHGSAGHAPANVEVCGIHVSCPVNGGTESKPRKCFFDISIRWGATNSVDSQDSGLSTGERKQQRKAACAFFPVDQV